MREGDTMKKSLKKFLIAISSIVMAVAVALLIFSAYVLVFDSHPKTVYDVSTKQDDGVVTVMNFNVRCLTPEDLGDKSWFSRADRVIKQIASVQPDIICFQEMTPFHEDYFSYALKGYEKVVKYRQTGLINEAAPIFFNASKFDMSNVGSFWLSETPDKMSKGWGAANYRICSSVVLTQKTTGKSFAVYNTHLDHKSELARINGIQLVLDKITEYGSVPSMLLGDMNAYPNSETYKKATENFADSRVVATESEENRGTWHDYGKVDYKEAIDYCFVTPNAFDVLSYHVLAEKVDGKFASDHYALVIKLNLK